MSREIQKAVECDPTSWKSAWSGRVDINSEPMTDKQLASLGRKELAMAAALAAGGWLVFYMGILAQAALETSGTGGWIKLARFVAGVGLFLPGGLGMLISPMVAWMSAASRTAIGDQDIDLVLRMCKGHPELDAYRERVAIQGREFVGSDLWAFKKHVSEEEKAARVREMAALRGKLKDGKRDDAVISEKPDLVRISEKNEQARELAVAIPQAARAANSVERADFR